MKGNLYANPTFIHKNLYKPTILLIEPLIAYDDNRLYFNGVSIKWETRGIVNCTYSKYYKILLILTDSYRIHVFTDHLEEITTLSNWDPKYVVGFQLLEQQSILVLVGTEEVAIMKVSIQTNVKKTKFLSSMKFALKKESLIKTDQTTQLEWNKGYGVEEKDNLIYVWSQKDINFYLLSNLQLQTSIKNLTKKQNCFTAVHYNSHYRYTVTGLLDGEIKVWRLPTSDLSVFKQILIHNFTYHCRQIQQIIAANDEKTIVSYSADLNVCFLSLETFQILRSFNFVGEYSKIYVRDAFSAFALKDGYLGELNFGKTLEFIVELTGPIISHHKFHPSNSIFNPTGFSQSIQLTLGSNLGVQLIQKQLNQSQELNKINIQYIYPPLKAKNILQILACPYEQNRYFLMVEGGELYKLRIQNNSGRIENNYHIHRCLDQEKHQLNQNAALIRFLPIPVPSFDTENMESSTIQKLFQTEAEMQKAYESFRLLTIGCVRGSVIFVSVDNLERIHARISYHREKIEEVLSLYNKKTKQCWIVSMCSERYMKFVTFRLSKAQCLFSIYCGQSFLWMKSFEDNLALVFTSGSFEITYFEENCDEPQIIINPDAINHEGEILSLDVDHSKQLVLTAATDNKIKIWTYSKILIYEIHLDNGLNYCLWVQNLQILMMQNHKLVYLRDVPLKLKSTEVKLINQKFKADNLEYQITISQFIEHVIIKERQQINSNKTYHSPKKKYKLDQIRLNKSIQLQKSTPINSPPQNRKSLMNNKSTHFSHNKSTHLSNNESPLRKAIKTEQNEDDRKRYHQRQLIPTSDQIATRQHIDQMAKLKKQTHQCILPKIKPKSDDIFVEFMREKLLNKRLLTRRDITLNRIIMKNIIKDHLGSQSEIVKNLKLD